MSVLKQAYERENDPRDRRPEPERCWEYYAVGSTRQDITRMLEEGLIALYSQNRLQKRYRLSQKGRDLVWSTMMNAEFEKVPAENILDAMTLIVGFDDIKETIARAVEARKRIHFLMEGPPACAKSLLLEAVRSTVPDAYMAFGSRTSSSGLSDALFERQPSVLLMDEADKMHADVFSVMLGLMESGEIIETKSKKTRGVKLETIVIAACNSSVKMPREFLSRFALHVHFPQYTREEFIDVCKGFLARAEGCPEELAARLGRLVFDWGLGDVRKARSVWQLMTEPSEEEAMRVLRLMLRYSSGGQRRQPKTDAVKMPGL